MMSLYRLMEYPLENQAIVALRHRIVHGFFETVKKYDAHPPVPACPELSEEKYGEMPVSFALPLVFFILSPPIP